MLFNFLSLKTIQLDKSRVLNVNEFLLDLRYRNNIALTGVTKSFPDCQMDEIRVTTFKKENNNGHMIYIASFLTDWPRQMSWKALLGYGIFGKEKKFYTSHYLSCYCWWKREKRFRAEPAYDQQKEVNFSLLLHVIIVYGSSCSPVLLDAVSLFLNI